MAIPISRFMGTPTTTASFINKPSSQVQTTNTGTGTPSVNNLLTQFQNLGAFGPVKADALATATLVDPLFGKQAQDFRTQIYNQGNQAFQAATDYAKMYGRSAADLFADPYWRTTLSELGRTSPEMQAAGQQIQRTLAGDYLTPSKELTAAVGSVQGAAERAAADESAQIRSRMAQAGMGFSTADLQAQQASGAAQRVAAQDTAVRLMAENYAQERANQQQAINQAVAAQQARAQQLGIGADIMGTQAGLMKGISAEMIAPLTQYASLLEYSKAMQLGKENIERLTPAALLPALMAAQAAGGAGGIGFAGLK
jgi:hypothetical protein